MEYINMDSDLRNSISATISSDHWEPVTSKMFPAAPSAPWQLWTLQEDIEYNGAMWRCCIVRMDTYNTDAPEEIDYSEDIFSSACKL